MLGEMLMDRRVFCELRYPSHARIFMHKSVFINHIKKYFRKSEYALNKHDQDSIIYISVVNVYTQRSEDSVKWRIEGNDSHGFTDRTRNEILEIENGEVKTIDCELTYTLGDDKEPYSLSVRTVINNEEIESLNYPLEGISVDKIDKLLDGSLYQSYIQQDWEELDSPPWVLEETSTIGTDQLKTRISQLYSDGQLYSRPQPLPTACGKTHIV